MDGAVTMPTVGELMTGDPIVVPVDLTLKDAARLMEFYRVSGLPVVDWDGTLVGVVSETDLVHALTTAPLWDAWPGLTVRHLMTHPAITVSAGAPAEDAARLMELHHIHRLVVISGDGTTPIGVVSAGDLVREMAGRE